MQLKAKTLNHLFLGSLLSLYLVACDGARDEPAAVSIASLPMETASEALAQLHAACPKLTNRGRFDGVCAALEQGLPDDPQAFLETHFTAQRLSPPKQTDGRFTGYFVPELKASREKAPGFETPIYGRPADLVDVPLSFFIAEEVLRQSPNLPRVLSGKVKEGMILPYASRAQIEAEPLTKADVIAWAADPIELFFLHIQGSGILRFTDGTRENIGYGGSNGRAYTAIGRLLIARGEVAREDMSLQAIDTWLRAHPDDAAALMQANERFTFFSPMGDRGPIGTLETPLIAEQSIAVDPSETPLGSLVFVDVPLPDGTQLTRFMLAADTGSAILGPGRGDIFFGSGPQAKAQAGKMNASGSFIMLLPKVPYPQKAVS